MIIDVAFLIALVFGFYMGFKRGIIKTLFSLVALIIAILASLKLSPLVIAAFEKALDIHPAINFLLGFVLTFIIAYFIIRIVGGRLEGAFKAINLNFINKIAGGILFSLLFVICFSSLLWFLNKSDLISDEAKESSFTYEQLEPVPMMAQGAIQSMKPLFKGFWDKTTETFDAIKERNE